MVRSILRILFAAAMTLSMTLGVFAGAGVSLASAAGSPTGAVVPGYSPVASVPTGVSYCYPSGYNRQGWRCGWRLAQAPYNLGSYYNRYYYGGYNYNYYGYYPYYNSGYGGRGPYPVINDYGGMPRYGYYYPYYYNSNNMYNRKTCYYGGYC